MILELFIYRENTDLQIITITVAEKRVLLTTKIGEFVAYPPDTIIDLKIYISLEML